MTETRGWTVLANPLVVKSHGNPDALAPRELEQASEPTLFYLWRPRHRDELPFHTAATTP